MPDLRQPDNNRPLTLRDASSKVIHATKHFAVVETKDGATYFAERVWGISLCYDLGSDHLLVGRSAPDFELIDGAKVGSLLRDGKGVLLQFDKKGIASGACERLGKAGYLYRELCQGTARFERCSSAS